MSKGTKQIRFGKVEKVIERLQTRKEIIEELKEIQTSEFSQGLQAGAITEIENIIKWLKDLEK